MRLRSVFAAAVAGLVALALAACSPGDDEPTASPTVASPTPTEVATTPSPMATPSPTPTLTQEEVHVAEATELLHEFNNLASTIANEGGVGSEALQDLIASPELQASYGTVWEYVKTNGIYTVGTPSIGEIEVLEYRPGNLRDAALDLRYCVDTSEVTQFDANGISVTQGGAHRLWTYTTVQLQPDDIWRIAAERGGGESC